MVGIIAVEVGMHPFAAAQHFQVILEPGKGMSMKKEAWSGRTSFIRYSRSRRTESTVSNGNPMM